MIQWSKKFSTGIELIDQQHQDILSQLEQLETATSERRTMLAVYVMSRLNSYTREHFATEEMLMKANAYPGLEAHKLEHLDFRARVDALLVQAITQDVTMEVVELVKTWLLDHITGSDMDYVPYLKKKDS